MLADFIDPIYLTKDIVMQIRAQYKKDKYILIEDFLQKNVLNKAKKELKQARFRKFYIPDEYSYSIARIKLNNFLSSKEFMQYLSIITGKNVDVKTQLYKFGKGDYTVLKDKRRIKGGFAVVLGQWNIKWGGKIMRGKDIFVAPKENTLILTEEGPWFVQYVNHHGKNLYLAGNYPKSR